MEKREIVKRMILMSMEYDNWSKKLSEMRISIEFAPMENIESFICEIAGCPNYDYLYELISEIENGERTLDEVADYLLSDAAKVYERTDYIIQG